MCYQIRSMQSRQHCGMKRGYDDSGNCEGINVESELKDVSCSKSIILVWLLGSRSYMYVWWCVICLVVYNMFWVVCNYIREGE